MADPHTSQELAQPGGPFDEYIYALILDAALEDWSPESYFNIKTKRNIPSRKDLEVQKLLARCCAVNREWHKISQRLLYKAVMIDDGSRSWQSPADTLRKAPDIAEHVRYLYLNCLDLNATELLINAGTFNNLRCLVVTQGMVMQDTAIPLRPQVSQNLTHLLYKAGDTHLLGQMLAVLPHLQTLHVGRFEYSRHKRPPLRDTPINCRLREVVFQSGYHYDAKLFEWLFASSRDSIECLTVAHFGSLLNDLLPYFGKAKRLDLTVKNNVFGVPEEPDHYQLSAIIPQFKVLEELHLHVGQDWRSEWPDPKHALLQEEFLHIRIFYEPYKHNFLECIV